MPERHVGASGPAQEGATDDSGHGVAEPTEQPDPGLRGVDYAGISPLTLPAEVLLRAINAFDFGYVA